MSILGILSSLIGITSDGTSPLLCTFFSSLFIGFAVLSCCFAALEAVLRLQSIRMISTELENENFGNPDKLSQKFLWASVIFWFIFIILYLVPPALLTTVAQFPLWAPFTVCGSVHLANTTEFNSWFYGRLTLVFLFFPAILIQTISLILVKEKFQHLVFLNMDVSSNHYSAKLYINRYGFPVIASILVMAQVNHFLVQQIQAITLAGTGVFNSLAYKWNDELSKCFKLIEHQSMRSSTSRRKQSFRGNSTSSQDTEESSQLEATVSIPIQNRKAYGSHQRLSDHQRDSLTQVLRNHKSTD
ncbi:hypothetical protein Ciccas_013836 [Cichlidogyrus casuarinus]|uniref:G-protein coupled receptors family 1 profile domain-containing protein n=1 Tax=Cichlidogyrus casuarinus TaxID=1844966 RepID=A0ABD2PKM3_9PLAT